jgi:predicted CopG family antitoxin
MKRNPPKMVLVEETLHQKLLILKASKGLKSLSEVIELLIKKQEA